MGHDSELEPPNRGGPYVPSDLTPGSDADWRWLGKLRCILWARRTPRLQITFQATDEQVRKRGLGRLLVMRTLQAALAATGFPVGS